MAQLNINVSRLQLLIEKVRPAVEKEDMRVVEKQQEELRKYRKRLKELECMPPIEEVKAMAKEMQEYHNKDAWFGWQAMSFDAALLTVQKKLANQRFEDVGNLKHEYQITRTPSNGINNMLNYLEALCKRLSGDSVITLSERETHQMEKAMELAGVTL